ncbi:mavicyanin-like [Vicia villosa]|uniref:mavicyanin-like n=1 Tax=Vicia villosa TaxID=3911 RepID=UPI00273B4315|nr:mavicyanin-like [Vicia villosa]
MSHLKNMSIILVIAFVATIVERTDAVDHTVGDTTGWTNSAGAKFYSDWASNNTFKQNDVLVFNFVAGGHSVAEINKADFDNCNVNSTTNAITTTPARFTLNRTGDFYFTCTFPTHCQTGGQKLTVKVPASSSSTPPSATPPSSGTTPTSPTSGGTPSPSSPTQPGATPPSPGSATALVATFPTLIALVINLLL